MHTPGSWGYVLRRFGEDLTEASIIGPNNEDIGFVNAGDGADEPTFYPAEGNARLIAAAPDMLAELQQCALEMDEAANLIAPNFPRAASLFVKAAERARNTIAKATALVGKE